MKIGFGLIFKTIIKRRRVRKRRLSLAEVLQLNYGSFFETVP